jgi:uncharacterized protein YbdZ (MbtH family)
MVRVSLAGGVGFGRFAALLACMAGLAWGGVLLPHEAVASTAPSGVQAQEEPSQTPSRTKPYYACPRSKSRPDVITCDGVIVPRAYRRAQRLRFLSGVGDTEGGLQPDGGHGKGATGFDPADLQRAYNLPSATAGSGQTVGVVIVGDNPDAESDLATYRAGYGLSPCTTANGCFKKVNRFGEQRAYPAPAGGNWAVEGASDIELVSAICPNCHIILVEAPGPEEDSTLATAEDTAVALGANEITNSWSHALKAEDLGYEEAFNHPGVLITVAGGDRGYTSQEWPSESPHVMAVGGTSLFEAPDARGFEEFAWSLGGSTCAQNEPKPSWQTDTGCAYRTTSDISAVADWKNSPVSIYDAYEHNAFGEIGWESWGGTSASSPIIAATYALTNAYTRSLGPQAIWQYAKEGGSLNDIVSGKNSEGGCTVTYLCWAGPGYDGPTGWGTPWGAPTVRQRNLLTNASFAKQPEFCGTPPGWFLNGNGGVENACSDLNASRSEQGNVFEEFNANVSSASIGQNIAIAPQVGQSYTFSIWVRAPEGEPTGQINVFGLNASEGIGDQGTTKFTANGKWQLVSVPLTVTQPGETSIRVQVYETAAGKNIDLDGGELLLNQLTNASFAKQPEFCGTPPGWFLNGNGGVENACADLNASRSEQGNVFEEFNANVSSASIGQNIAIAPQVGQSYTFSVWVRAPEGEPTGQVNVFGLNSGEAVRDEATTKFAANGKWQLVSVPLTVTQPNEASIRVQVYETTAGKNIDLDGGELLLNQLTNASFAKQPEFCGTPPGWFLNGNGGVENACADLNASRSEQGNVFEEFNANVSSASIGQNIAIAPQVGQSYTFSVWVRAPEGEPTGQVNVFGLNSGEAVRDEATTKFAANGKWQLVSVPLTVTQPAETSIRVQVYETTASKNIDLDGAQLH